MKEKYFYKTYGFSDIKLLIRVFTVLLILHFSTNKQIFKKRGYNYHLK